MSTIKSPASKNSTIDHYLPLCYNTHPHQEIDMYWLGLIIVSMAVGHRYDQIDGWLTLGGGMIVFAILHAVLRRIPVRK
jgi:hypothetical protein